MTLKQGRNASYAALMLVFRQNLIKLAIDRSFSFSNTKKSLCTTFRLFCCQVRSKLPEESFSRDEIMIVVARLTLIFVDKDCSIYISDSSNHRVMKWLRNVKEGIIVAGGNCDGNSLRQLADPCGIVVDEFGNVYVGDNRIMF